MESAVEFLNKRYRAQNGVLFPADFEQAKEMEKEQMWNYIKVNYVNGENSLAFHKEEFEQYYNETFKSE